MRWSPLFLHLPRDVSHCGYKRKFLKNHTISYQCFFSLAKFSQLGFFPALKMAKFLFIYCFQVARVLQYLFGNIARLVYFVLACSQKMWRILKSFYCHTWLIAEFGQIFVWMIASLATSHNWKNKILQVRIISVSFSYLWSQNFGYICSINSKIGRNYTRKHKFPEFPKF